MSCIMKYIVIVVIVSYLSATYASKSGLTLFIKRQYANSKLGFSLHNDLFLVKGGNVHHDYQRLTNHDLPLGVKRIEMSWIAFNYPVNYTITMSTSDRKIMHKPQVSPIAEKGQVSKGGSFEISLPCTGLVRGIVRVVFILNYTKRGSRNERSTNNLKLSFTVTCNKTISENNSESTENEVVDRATVVTVSGVIACVVVIMVAIIFFWRHIKRIRKKYGFDISDDRFSPLEEISGESSSNSSSQSPLPTVVYSPQKQRSVSNVYTKIIRYEEDEDMRGFHNQIPVSTTTSCSQDLSYNNENNVVFTHVSLEDDVFDENKAVLAENSLLSPTSLLMGRSAEDRKEMYTTLNDYWSQQFKDCLKSPEDFEICSDILGEGMFSRVYRAKLTRPISIEVACKVCKEEIGFEQMVSCINEAVLINHLRHENLLNIIGVVLQPSCPPQILTPLMSHGDLHKFLRHSRGIGIRRQLIGSKQLVNFAGQIASGMEYLASQNIVHRDLCARNCFVNEDLTVKIGDFGLARKQHQFDMYKMENPGQLAVKWLAIESLLYYIFTEKSDVWSFGILLWELVTLGSQPYAGLDNNEVTPYLENGKRLSRPLRCPDDLFAIMSSCWLPEANERPSFSVLLHKLQDYEQRLRPSCIAFEFDEDTIEMTDDCDLY